MFSTTVPLRFRFCVDRCAHCHHYGFPLTHRLEENYLRLNYQCKCRHTYSVSCSLEAATAHSTAALIDILEAGLGVWNKGAK